MRSVVEEHQARMNQIAEVDHVQGRRRLIEAIAVTAGVDAKQAAEQQSNRGLVRNDENLRALVIADDPSKRRQCTREHCDARLSPAWRAGKGILLPHDVFSREPLFDFLPLQPLPMTM